MNLNRYIDHTVLKATSTEQDIIALCSEAVENDFYAVCVNGCYVATAVDNLGSSNVKVAAVIGFPLGAMSAEAKVFEAQKCVEQGADEIDMVLNIGMLKSGKLEYVENEIREIKKAIGNKVLKVILENCYLTQEEIKTACQLCVNANADFVKTSTGFGTGGATLEDIKTMKSVVGDRAQIKAAGGVRDTETAYEFIKAGASRLGTSSGVSLVKEGTSKKGEY